MAAYNKVNSFVEALAEKVHNLGSDTLRVLLTNSAPTSASTKKADLTEISAGNGYSAGGPALTVSSSAQSGGTYKLVIADEVITASGGSIGPFQYAALYNDTATNDEMLGWYDYGSALTLADTETFTIDFDGTGGVLTLA